MADCWEHQTYRPTNDSRATTRPHSRRGGRMARLHLAELSSNAGANIYAAGPATTPNNGDTTESTSW
jgi:hypothetical protein